LDDVQCSFAQPRSAVAGWTLDHPDRITLADVVRNAKPTALIGYTAAKDLFDDQILRLMAEASERPVILALSNPNSQSECTPEEALKSTDGRALVATGSPFPPVHWRGHEIHTAQCNNLYIFPGVGLGALVSRAGKATDGMFTAAARALSAMVTAKEEAQGLLLPQMHEIREVAARVALAVAIEARDTGLGRLLPDEELARLIGGAQWSPHFVPYRPGAHYHT
jgi:malate dehydrogenase (oxaloacetate-decarboxylating)